MSHPEFGYFCPAPRLRRDFRVAFVASVFGVFIGSLTVLVLSTGTHNPDQESATLITNPRPAETSATRLERQQDPRGIEPPLQTATPSRLQRDKVGSWTTDRLGPASLRSVDNPPEIARIPLGRPGSLERAPADTTAQTGQHPTIPEVAHPSAITTSQAVAEDAASERSESAPGLPKKIHKPHRAQNRRHSERSLAVRRGREDFGRAYARDSSYGRLDFWVWSW
jgi:hypothetical protein